MTIDEAINRYKNQLKEFFQKDEIRELVAQKDFDEIYKRWKQETFAFILTAFFLKCDINPLTYLSYIPDAYIGFLDLTKLEVPINIKYIQFNAFIGAPYLKTIYYQGSKKDWKEIPKPLKLSIKVYCKDGETDFE